MASAASIVVLDRAGTPVSHTFAYRGDQSDGSALFSEPGAAGVPIGDRKISISSRLSNGKYRTRLRVENPTLVNEVVNGVTVPKVPRTAYAVVDFTFSNTSSQQERKDTIAFLANALAASQTMVLATVQDFEQVT